MQVENNQVQAAKRQESNSSPGREWWCRVAGVVAGAPLGVVILWYYYYFAAVEPFLGKQSPYFPR